MWRAVNMHCSVEPTCTPHIAIKVPVLTFPFAKKRIPRKRRNCNVLPTASFEREMVPHHHHLEVQYKMTDWQGSAPATIPKMM